MNDLDTLNQLSTTEDIPLFIALPGKNTEHAKLIQQHKLWLSGIRHERPNTVHPYQVGVYIRYFNQTKYEDYLSNHKKQFIDAIALCPKWTLTDFYVDEGSVAPKMESAPEWSRLIMDCMDGKVDLIITQKLSNVSRDPDEITICARLLASQPHPVGIYFISEDVFTLSSYYLEDLKDRSLLCEEDVNAFMQLQLNEGPL